MILIYVTNFWANFEGQRAQENNKKAGLICANDFNFLLMIRWALVLITTANYVPIDDDDLMLINCQIEVGWELKHYLFHIYE